MQEPRYEDLERRASDIAETDAVRRLEAKSRVHGIIEAMKEAGEAMTLSEEEEKMLWSFRRFKLRMRKDGEVFKWQTRKPDGVQLASETAQILTPQEASE